MGSFRGDYNPVSGGAQLQRDIHRHNIADRDCKTPLRVLPEPSGGDIDGVSARNQARKVVIADAAALAAHLHTCVRVGERNGSTWYTCTTGIGNGTGESAAPDLRDGDT